MSKYRVHFSHDKIFGEGRQTGLSFVVYADDALSAKAQGSALLKTYPAPNASVEKVVLEEEAVSEAKTGE